MSDDKPEADKPEATETEATSAPAPSSEADHIVRTTETVATPEERSNLQLSDEPKPDEPKKNNSHDKHAPAHAHDHGDGHDHDHGLAHTMPIPLLFGVLAALLTLTVATVAVTSIDLGAQGNLIVAMIIATVKALLVCIFFMHLLWDKKFNLVLFLTSVLFLILFLGMTTADRGENQHAIDEYRALQLGVK
jgi:cytochrome c oxidase subunit 4